jgi:hypothetical protein
LGCGPTAARAPRARGKDRRTASAFSIQLAKARAGAASARDAARVAARDARSARDDMRRAAGVARAN